MPGDCGAWVVNASTGLVYGHIVAGDPVTGMAFIIPAHKVFSDIELRFGIRPALSTEQPRAQLTASSSYTTLTPLSSSIDLIKALQASADLFKAVRSSNERVKAVLSSIDQAKAVLHTVQLSIESSISIDMAEDFRVSISTLNTTVLRLNELIGLSLFAVRQSSSPLLLQSASWIRLYWYTAMISSVQLFRCGINVLGNPINSLLMGYLLICHANLIFCDALAEAALDIQISRSFGRRKLRLLMDDYVNPLTRYQIHLTLIANSFTPTSQNVPGTATGSITPLYKSSSCP